MKRAAFDRFDRVIERVVRRQNDDLRFRSLSFDLIKRLQSFRVRQLQIQQNQRCRFIFQCFQSSRGGGGSLSLESMAAEQCFEREQNRSLVIDD